MRTCPPITYGTVRNHLQAELAQQTGKRAPALGPWSGVAATIGSWIVTAGYAALASIVIGKGTVTGICNCTAIG